MAKKIKQTVFVVLQRFAYGWDFAPWSETGDDNVEQPIYFFFTQVAAQRAIDEFLAEIQEAVDRGDMEAYDPDDYAVAEVEVTVKKVF